MAQSKIAALEELKGATADSLSFNNLKDIPNVNPSERVETFIKNHQTKQDVKIKNEPMIKEKYGASSQPLMIRRPDHPLPTIVPNRILSAKVEPPTVSSNSSFKLNPDARVFIPPQVKDQTTQAPSRFRQRPAEQKDDNLQQPTSSNSTTNNVELGLLELANSLARQMSVTRLPPPEPSIFQGDPLKYPSWKASFDTLIEQRQIPSSEKIHYLKRYLGRQVKDVIENYFLMYNEDA